MEEELKPVEIQDQQKARIKSGVVFLILLAILVLPIMSYQNPPPEREGVLVRLGGDFGQGPDNSAKSEDAIPPPVEEDVPEEATPPEEVEKPKEVKKKPEKKEKKKVVTSDNSKEIAIKKAKAKKARDEKRREDAEAKRKSDAEAKRKSDAAKKRKAEQDAANNMDFGIKNDKGGKGGGDDDKGGVSGSKDGSPDGISKLGSGNGRVGGGLGSRGRSGDAPKLREKSNKSGTVVVYICVNSSGKVSTARVQQGGTTIQDSGLHAAAVSNAKQFKFKSSSQEKQCGTVTYKFKVH